MPQLKKISNELSTRTQQFTITTSNPIYINIIFFPPKSGSRKSEWVSAIASYFRLHGSNNKYNIYNILNGTSNNGANNGTSNIAASAAASRSTPSVARAAPPAKKQSPKKKSPSKAKSNNSATKKSTSPVARAKKKSPAKKKRITKNTTTTTTSDEAMAISIQNRYMEGIGQFGMPNQNGNLQQMGNSSINRLGLGGSSHANFWGNLLANSMQNNYAAASAMQHSYAASAVQKNYAAASAMQNNYAAAFAGAALTNGGDSAIMPNAGLETAKPAHLPVKVKKEPLSMSSISAAAASTTASDTPLQPRDMRESGMVSNLRGMGFNNTTEILTALRAVEAQREEASIIPAGGMVGGSGWNAQEQVEAAMMWIVSQREEAEEARKLDEARISSEQADLVVQQSRKQSMELELKKSGMVDLLGSMDGDEVGMRSKHYPFSALLRHQSVKSVLNTIATCDSIGKDQVIRLLNLEKKSRKWFGTVLPFSFMEYELKPRIEGWTGETKVICQKLSNESDELEKAMYNLSEQVEGGLGSVPKLFFDAQREATERGKPTTSPDDSKMGNDDEVKVVERLTRSSGVTNAATGKSCLEVIDIS